MRHERHYSVEQANAALSWVGERLAAMRSAREELNDEEARAALSNASPSNGGGGPGLVVSRGFLALRGAFAELQAMEVVLRDLERGLVDFPAVREGEEIYLCWEEGEPEVGYWHGPESGFDGRRPL